MRTKWWVLALVMLCLADIASVGTTVTPNGDQLFVDRTSVQMAARHNGSATPPNLVSRTPPETIHVLHPAGGLGISWSVDACENYDPAFPEVCMAPGYVQVAPARSIGAGRFAISLIDSASLPIATGATPLRVTVRVRQRSAAESSMPIVNLFVTVYGPGSPATRPAGQVDLPDQNATVQGAMNVSGWVVDDIGVDAVRIYRNCFTAYELPNCVTGILPDTPGTPVTLVGEAPLVAGARPDIEGQYAAYPQAHRAGWGLSVLTNMLPTTSPPFSPYRGQGPLTLYVIAVDVEGTRALLGRTIEDQTPTSIAMDNATLAHPFGEIDGPAPGASLAGTTLINGWALSPDTGQGLIIAPTGATMRVFVDGLPVGQPTYNQCRGSVGSPPPPGMFCDDDIANIFGTLTPQPPLTPRTSNPTRYRNLDGGLAAIGWFVLDTSELADGAHALAWSVTDAGQRVAAVGNRAVVIDHSAAARAAGGRSSASPLASTSASPSGGLIGERTTAMTGARLAKGTVAVRTGWALDAPFAGAPEAEGVATVEVDAGSRLELSLPPAPDGSWEGYLVAADRLLPLPAGTSFEPAGRFYWQPIIGFRGAFDLLFVRAGAGGTETLPVRVTIR